jgi:hypothetical protein
MTLEDVLISRVEYAKILAISQNIAIDNPTGPGYMEISGINNANIDLKNPTSDDYDLRIGTLGGTSATIESGNNQQLSISAGNGIILIGAASGNVRITDGGNCGIGTANPQDKLHVSDSGDNTYIGLNRELLEIGTSSSGAIYFGDDFSNPTSGIESSWMASGTIPSISFGVTRDGNKTRVTAQYDNRIKFFTNDVERMQVTNNTIKMLSLGTYANNAAAIAGGLAVNDVYKTATGELRIVV